MATPEYDNDVGDGDFADFTRLLNKSVSPQRELLVAYGSQHDVDYANDDRITHISSSKVLAPKKAVMLHKWVCVDLF
jgi:hypothetical protein